MHLSFLKELFSQYTVELYAENDSEWVEIKNQAFNDLIKVYYAPEDFDIYCLVFATQHVHISKKERLIEYVTAFRTLKRQQSSSMKTGAIVLGEISELPYLTILHTIVCEITLVIRLSILGI